MKNLTYPEKVRFIANRTAREYGTNRATKIVYDHLQPELAKVIEYDEPHAESRTGIRAKLCALKRYWHTYHYVPVICVVSVNPVFV